MTVLRKFFYLFIFSVAGTFIGTVADLIVTQLYNSLARLVPALFPLYNVVLEKEAHEAQEAKLSVIALFVTVLAVVYLTQRFNNERFEFVISKTDGVFYLRDTLPLYLKRFALSDVISSLAVALIFTLPISFIPMQFFAAGSAVSTLILPYKMLCENLGVPLAASLLALFYTVAHAAVTPPAILYYRAKWLSGFAEG